MKRLLPLAAAGALVATAASAEPTLQSLQDRMVLAYIPTQIEQAVDRKDWDRARSYFADEVRVDFTSMAGGEPSTIPADGLIAGWSGNLKGNKQSLHIRGTPIITVQGDTATAVSNGYAWNRLPGAPDGWGDLWEVWGIYTHDFTRTDSGWKVTGFAFEMTHERGSDWVKTTPGS